MKIYECFLYALCKLVDPFKWNKDYHNGQEYIQEHIYRHEHYVPAAYVPIHESIITKMHLSILGILIDLVVHNWLKDPFYLVLSLLSGDICNKMRSIFMITYERIEYQFPIEAYIFVDPYYIILAESTFCEKLTGFITYFDIFDKKLQSMIHPCASVFWFYYLNMFEQYKNIMHQIIVISCLYLSTLSESRIDRLFLTMIFNDSSYLEYFVFNKILNRTNTSVYNALCCLFYVSERYVMWMFKNTGSGNLNFVNWFNMFFVLVNVFNYNIMYLAK